MSGVYASPDHPSRLHTRIRVWFLPHERGPLVADNVTIQSPVGEEKDIPREAAPFFVNSGWVVLTSDGRVNSKATATAQKEN